MHETFCTTCGNPAPCLSQRPTGLTASSLLLAIGASCIATWVWLTLFSTLLPTPALPPTPSAVAFTPATPSIPLSTTAPSPSSTPDPFAPTPTPAILLVIEVTITPTPSPTLTPYEATLRAGQATATALAAPVSCERTTVTPGETRVCYWMAVLPTPTLIPTLPPCQTPVPLMRCLKVSE